MEISRYSKVLIIFIILLTIIFSFGFSGCYAELPIKLNDTSAESAKETAQGYLNDFTLLDLDGNEVSLHDYKGKIVVLNFWATWCPPCQAEIPDFVEVSNTYKDKGVQFLGISDDGVHSLKAFTMQYKINYPTLLDGTKDRVLAKWGINAIPHTFILDGNGEIVFDQLGMMSKEQLVNAIEAALQAKQ